MADHYPWQQASVPSYRSTNQDHLGWWAAAAMLVSVLLHVIVFFALDQVKIVLGMEPSEETVTRTVVIRDPVERMPEDFTPTAPPDDFVAPPPESTKLLDDVDLLDAVKNLDVDVRPDISETTVAIMPGNSAAAGDPKGPVVDATPSVTMADMDLDLPDFGRSPTEMKPAAIGQVTVDPGSAKSLDSELSDYADQLLKKGAGGKLKNGSLDGVASLDDLIGLPSNELLGKKTMLPSDLLFEFNKFELRDSAKIGLFKLGMLLDNNPDMYCWIEGHTDLIGGDAPNLELSVKRAEAVKDYLVNSMKYPASRIFTRGYGRFHPIVTEGDKDAQALNRRVEIKMRKTPPTEEQMKITPPKAAVEEAPPKPVAVPAEGAPKPMPVKEEEAVLVKPDAERIRAAQRERERMREPAAPKATPVEETPPPRARPVAPEMPEEAPVRAIPVVEEVLRAQPVEE